MKPKLLLRIAFGLLLFHLLGHTMGHFTWKDPHDPVLTDIINRMDTHKFEFMGTQQTIGEHHEGYSLMLGLTLIMGSIVTWIFSRKIESLPQLRDVILVVGIFLIVFGAVEAVYFFPLPGITSILAGLFYIGAARITAKH